MDLGIAGRKALINGGSAGMGRGAGGFLPGGKNFPLKKGRVSLE